MKIESSLYIRKTLKGFDKRELRHICIREFVFWQPKTVGNKTWNTGVFEKKLSQLSKTDGPAMGNSIVIKRAWLILEMRTMTSKTPHPTKGYGFYNFEEDLTYHVRGKHWQSLALVLVHLSLTIHMSMICCIP
jgi:hypothetical protein